MTCEAPLQALEVLQGLPGLMDVSLYGDALHVLVSEGEPGDIEAALAAAGIDGAHASPIAPSLEDVFISLMRRH